MTQTIPDYLTRDGEASTPARTDLRVGQRVTVVIEGAIVVSPLDGQPDRLALFMPHLPGVLVDTQRAQIVITPAAGGGR